LLNKEWAGPKKESGLLKWGENGTDLNRRFQGGPRPSTRGEEILGPQEGATKGNAMGKERRIPIHRFPTQGERESG